MRGAPLLLGVVGSQAYGLATPESDIDRLGVYQAPTDRILGLKEVKETIVSKDNEGDVTYHEVLKFMRLCMNANPTVSELLWLDDYLVATWAGKLLIENREAFLSKKALSAYVGYAMQQAERLKRRGDFDPDLKKRTAKHGRHCYRLLIQCEDLINRGLILVRLSKRDAVMCRQMGEWAENEPEEYYDFVKDRCDMIKALPCSLPATPDVETLNEVLLRIRRSDNSPMYREMHTPDPVVEHNRYSFVV